MPYVVRQEFTFFNIAHENLLPVVNLSPFLALVSLFHVFIYKQTVP